MKYKTNKTQLYTDNLDALNEMSSLFEAYLLKQGLPKGDCVYYGSWVTNKVHKKSDVDVMYIYKGEGIAKRLDYKYKNYPVSLYIVPLKEYLKDGKDRKYGGYFSMKTLNPFIKIGNNISEEQIYKTIGSFIGPFAYFEAKNKNQLIGDSQIIALQALTAYAKLCPPYAGYCDKLLKNKNIRHIFPILSQSIISSFISAKIIKKRGARYQYIKQNLDENLERWKAISAFSAFGSIEHSNDFEWPLKYIKKSKMEDKEYNYYDFLKEIIND